MTPDPMATRRPALDLRGAGLALVLAAALASVALPAAAANVDVNVSDNVFNPPQVVIQAGDTVTWSNVQGTHNVVADDATFSSGEPSPAPWTFSYTFTTPGSFGYYDELNGGPGGQGMSGVVVVQDEANEGSVAFASTAFTTLESSTQAMVTVRRTGGSDGVVSIDYSTFDGDAQAGQDYEATTGSISWQDGESGDKSFTVPVFDDIAVEPDETLEVVLSNPIGGVQIGSPAETTVTIIDDDGSGDPCSPSTTALCLNDARFRVRAVWRTGQGVTGSGRAVTLTGDTGYFWFFNEENVEVVVKVLDGCPVNGHYWVFAAGLTNVEVTMTVEDTTTGTVSTYRNTLHTPFQPRQDTAAFATCP